MKGYRCTVIMSCCFEANSKEEAQKMAAKHFEDINEVYAFDAEDVVAEELTDED